MRNFGNFAIAVCAFLAQGPLASAAQARLPRPVVTITVVDEVGTPVSGAQVTMTETGHPSITLQTDFAGRGRVRFER